MVSVRAFTKLVRLLSAALLLLVGCGEVDPCTGLARLPDVRIVRTEPASPANHNHPVVFVTGSLGPVAIFEAMPGRPGCGRVLGRTEAYDDDVGVEIEVPDDAVTELTAATFTPCSSLPVGCTDVATYVEDSTAPSAPRFMGSQPASPGDADMPILAGEAEPEVEVVIYGSSACDSFFESGRSRADGRFFISVPATESSTTSFTARAVDAAGNTSECSEPFEFVDL